MILSCSTPWSRSWMQEASTAWRSKNATGRNQHCSLVCKLGPCNKLRFVVSVNESFLEQIHFLSNIRPLFEVNMKARSVLSVWQVAILMKVKQCVKSLLVFVVGHISCYFHQLTLSVRRSRKGKKTERLGKSGEETFIFCLSSTTNKEAISIWLKLRRMSEVRVQIISLPLFMQLLALLWKRPGESVFELWTDLILARLKIFILARKNGSLRETTTSASNFHSFSK